MQLPLNMVHMVPFQGDEFVHFCLGVCKFSCPVRHTMAPSSLPLGCASAVCLASRCGRHRRDVSEVFGVFFFLQKSWCGANMKVLNVGKTKRNILKDVCFQDYFPFEMVNFSGVYLPKMVGIGNCISFQRLLCWVSTVYQTSGCYLTPSNHRFLQI